MFKDIFLFELKYRFGRPATWIYFLVLLVISVLLFGTGNTGASENVFHNGPITITNLILQGSIIGILFASAVMGVPLYRDLEHKTGTFLFSYPITKFGYFMGRFWGSFVTMMFISTGALIGVYLGSVLGPLFGTPPEEYGPNYLINYLYPWVTLLFPNSWLAATLFFALIVFTKKIRSIYSGGIVVFSIYLIASFLSQNIENKDLVQLIDPFGINTFNLQTRYLTPYEKNNFYLPLEGNLLLNRMLWIGVGLVLFIAAYLRFNFNYFFNSPQKSNKEKQEKESNYSYKIPDFIIDFSKKYQWNSLKTLWKIEVQNIIKNNYFQSILLGGLIILIVDYWVGMTWYGTPNYPTTAFMVYYKTFNYNIFVFIIIVFFTGEAIHRDRSIGYSIINDTFPVKDGVVIWSKLLSMAFICLILTTIPFFAGILVQTLKGYFNYELEIYLIDGYLISLPDYLQMVLLVFVVHMVVHNKFAGHFTAIIIWMAMYILRNFADFDFNMFFYSYKPNWTWSDMNGLGHFVKPLFWFNLYWSAWGLFLVLFLSIFYSRGTENNWKSRWQIAKSRLSKPAPRLSFLFLLIALVSGGFIFNNVVYKNNYRTTDENTIRAVAYEKQLKKYDGIPQPKYTKVNIQADFFPMERKANFLSEVELVNKTNSPIDSIHFNSTSMTDFKVILDGDTLDHRFPLEYEPNKFQIFGKKEESEWYKITALPQPMMPGDTLQFTIVSEAGYSGFPNAGFQRSIVYNGTFYAGGIPALGYNSSEEISSDRDRRKFDLPEKIEYEPPHDDSIGRSNIIFGDDSDLIQFEALVSTVPAQIVVAPGYLQQEWEKNGRRYFHYIQDNPIINHFAFVSAKYEVLRDEVKLPGGQIVDIEIFYHKPHKYNLDRFRQSLKDGLDYFSETYGNFQFRQIRLLEFPVYGRFAQSFANTIPNGESGGWVADFSDPNDFDHAYYLTAHELAHQWWGHQITPNATLGSNLLSESLAEYSAIILTERKYGKDNIKRFLKMNLDGYLQGRANETDKENLFINCNRSYQWYYKGSLILYGLRDLIGPEAMDSALYKFNQDFGMRQEPPFPGSSDLYNYLAEATPDSLMYYLDDTWNKITLYDNRTDEATAIKVTEDEFDVTLNIRSQKLYADESGKESDAEYEADYIDIGIFTKDDTDENGRIRVNPLYIQKHRIKPGQSSITLRVKGEPVKAGIDPYNKLIDRIPDDNIVKITMK